MDPACPFSLQDELVALLPPGRVLTDTGDRKLLAVDASKLDGDCLAVVRPKTESEVISTMKFAAARGISVVPRGAGTSPTGSALAHGSQIVLDLSAMNRIIDLAPRDMVAVVEPGVMCGDLQSAAEAVGMFYPPDPASAKTSTLGGNVATCAGGLRAVKYGVTRDYVLGLRVVLADGRAIEVGGRPLKSVVGYDLARLFVGSEGTLGVLTQITLKLIPKPARTLTLFATFRDFEGGLLGADAILGAGILPRALEYMDADVMKVASAVSGVSFDPEVRSALLIEVDGSEASCREDAGTISQALATAGAATVEQGDDTEARDRLWLARRSISTGVLQVYGAKRSEDLGVPRGRLAEAVAAIKSAAQSEGAICLAYGHAGDANLHYNFPFNPSVAGAKSAVDRAVQRATAIALQLGGTISGEHGIGLKRREAMRAQVGAYELDLMRKIKTVFDPQGILNPGKMLPE